MNTKIIATSISECVLVKTIVSNIIYFNFVKVQMYTNLNILVLERQRFHQETSKAVYFELNKPVELGITFTSFIV